MAIGAAAITAGGAILGSGIGAGLNIWAAGQAEDERRNAQIKALEAMGLSNEEAQGYLLGDVVASQQLQGYLLGAAGIEPSLDRPSFYQQVAEGHVPNMTAAALEYYSGKDEAWWNSATLDDQARVVDEVWTKIRQNTSDKQPADQFKAAFSAFVPRLEAYARITEGYEQGVQGGPAPEYEGYGAFRYAGEQPGLPTLPEFAGYALPPDFQLSSVTPQADTYLGDIPGYERYDPTRIAEDPYYQFRAQEGQKAVEASAAARSGLLSGKTLLDLERFRQGLASEEGQRAFERNVTEYNLLRQAEAEARARGVEFDRERYQRILQDYGFDVARNQMLYDRALTEYQTSYGRGLDLYNLAASQEQEQRRRALQDYTVNLSTHEAEQAAEYGRWVDRWNQLAALAGKSQTGVTQTANQAILSGVSAAQGQQNIGEMQAQGLGAQVQSGTNLISDAIQGYNWWAAQQKPQTPAPVTIANPTQTVNELESGAGGRY